MQQLSSNEQPTIKEISDGVYVDQYGQQLTDKQVRQIVTPHDFNVATALVGRKLARPWRRGVAMAIDGLLITLLASGSLAMFIPVYAYLIWRCHQLANTRRRNILLALLPIACLLVYGQVRHVGERTDLAIDEAITVGTAAVQLSTDKCDADCAGEKSEQLIEILKTQQMPDNKAETTFKELLENSALSAEQQQAKLAKLQAARAELKTAQQLLDNQPQQQAPELNWWQRLQQSDHSLVKWVQGILTDLGISFGWAVVYFTVFISWNSGQTPGKRLLKICVVQLNNQPLSLWAAFGRQGGYSAGVATGLLGFFQIYWDPNRQAIQDKVADTLVLQN